VKVVTGMKEDGTHGSPAIEGDEGGWLGRVVNKSVAVCRGSCGRLVRGAFSEPFSCSPNGR